MKQLHREDLFGWSSFDESRNLDFHSIVWVRSDGNLLVDPLPLSSHDRDHLEQLGGAAYIVVTTSDHLRAGRQIAADSGAQLYLPRAEREALANLGARFVGEGDEVLPGIEVLEMAGSKTPGELALVLEGRTLITGDLVRGHRGGSLNLLPEAKLSDPAAARRSVARLAALPAIETVLVGDGWHVWRDGRAALAELL